MHSITSELQCWIGLQHTEMHRDMGLPPVAYGCFMKSAWTPWPEDSFGYLPTSNAFFMHCEHYTAHRNPKMFWGGFLNPITWISLISLRPITWRANMMYIGIPTCMSWPVDTVWYRHALHYMEVHYNVNIHSVTWHLLWSVASHVLKM